MTAQERARLIERLESVYPTGNQEDVYYAVLDRIPVLVADLRRLDVLEKAMRKLVEAISIEGESNHYDTVINNCFTDAKQALGDA